MSEIIENEKFIDENYVKNNLYKIRGKIVMLDFELANIYGYKTKDFNRQVKNNIERFDEDFMFQLNNEEFINLGCKNFTSNLNNYGGRRYLPYAFTEEGIYMLMTVLKGNLAVKQSKALIKIFKKMKDFIFENNNLVEQKYINTQVFKNTEDIKILKETIKQFEDDKVINEIYFKGQMYDAYSKIIDIFKLSKAELIIIDNYADKSLLDMISKLK